MYYLLAYITLAFLSLSLPQSKNKALVEILWFGTLFFLILFFGFRDNIGGDWWVYEKDFYLIDRNQGIIENLKQNNLLKNEIGYDLISIIIRKLNLSFHYVNIILSIIFFYCLHKFCSVQNNKFLALLISFPIFILVISNGFVRQGVAISIFMLATTFLCNGKNKLYFFWIIIAAFFHISAMIFLPILLFYRKYSFNLNNFYFFLIIIIFLISTGYIFHIKIFNLYSVYIEGAKNVNNFDLPTGAKYRLMLTFVASYIFLLFRKNLVKNERENKLYILLLLLFLLLVIGYKYFPVLSDRLNFFLISIQIFVFTRLPNIFSNQKTMLLSHLSIIFFYFVILTSWVLYATHSHYWFPYMNYLFI